MRVTASNLAKSGEILQLYPHSKQRHNLEGLYLSHALLKRSEEKPYVYGNFVTSLDGRIAIPHRSGSGLTVPDAIANPRDWRLFQELAVQSEMIISSGRYLRDYEAGRAQELLNVYSDPTLADLEHWRADNEMQPFPAIAVVSSSLRFPIPELLVSEDRTIVVFTTEQADPQRIDDFKAKGCKVVIAGQSSVGGKELVEAAGELGFRCIYSTSGPKVLHLLLADKVLDRLYLTLASRLLGGSPYSSIVEGSLLEPAATLQLRNLYYDPRGLEGLGQLFAAYNVSRN